MIRRISFLIAIGLFGLFGVAMSSASASSQYVGPSGVFTGPFTPGINSSLNTQQKNGSLGIGSVASPQQLCLNADGLDEPGNCIHDWSDLASAFGGPYVSLSQDGWALTDASTTCGDPSIPKSLCPTDYALQTGFVRLQATSPQAFSLITEAAALNACSKRSGSGPAGICNSGASSGLPCNVSSDCGLYSTAVYGNDASTSLNTAGYFSGVVYVSKPTNDSLAGFGRICLNGPVESVLADSAGGTCISSWNEISGSSSTLYVKRQQTSPFALQSQGAAISGVISVGSAVVGSTSGLPAGYTCGDGFCDATTGETSVTCPIDCETIPAPNPFSVSLSAGFVDMSIKTNSFTPPPSPPPGTTGVLVVRSSTGPSTFVPINGVTYTVGQVIGSDTVVYVGTVAQNQIISPHPSDTLPGAGTYYYRAFQANAFPRYGPGKDSNQLGPVVQLTAQVHPDNVGILESDDGQIACFRRNGPKCTAVYLVGETTHLSAGAITGGYEVSGIGGCDSNPTPDTCIVIMNTSRAVSADFFVSGPGGFGA